MVSALRPIKMAASAYAVGWSAYHVLSQGADPPQVSTEDAAREVFTVILGGAVQGASVALPRSTPTDIVSLAFSVASELAKLVIAAYPPAAAMAAQAPQASPQQPAFGGQMHSPVQGQMQPQGPRLPMSPQTSPFTAQQSAPLVPQHPAHPPAVGYPPQQPPGASPAFPFPMPAGSHGTGASWAQQAQGPYGPKLGPQVGQPITVSQKVPGATFEMTAVVHGPPAGWVPPAQGAPAPAPAAPATVSLPPAADGRDPGQGQGS